MSWQIAADIREMFIEVVATDGSKTIFGRNINRKDQLNSGLAEALSLLPSEFKAEEATLYLTSDFEKIALREHWGSHTAFLTTEGFENLLEIGNQTRTNLFGLHPEKIAPFISRDFAFGVTERTRADGSVEVGLDDKEIDFVMSKLAIAEVKSVAICFLHSDKNPLHEKQLAKKLTDNGYEVVCSHQFKGNELERAIRACSEAFVRPGTRTFLEEVQKLGFQADRIFLKGHQTSKPNDNNQNLFCEFLEDRIRVRYGQVFETETSPLSAVLIDEGGLVHVGPEKIESEPGPVAFSKGIHLSILDLIAFTNKLKAPHPIPRLKLDPNRVLKQLGPLAKQLQLDPETCAQKYLNLFCEKVAQEINLKIGGVDVMRNLNVEASGWLARILGYPIARNAGARSFRIPHNSSWISTMSLIELKSASASPESWGALEFDHGSKAEGESIAF